MKNRIIFIIIFLFQFFLINKAFSNEVEFKAKNIEIIDDGNLTVANNAIAFIKEDNISINGKKIKYFKNESLLIVEKGSILLKNKSISIKSSNIKYSIDKSFINFQSKVIINDQISGLQITSNEINFDNNDQIIKSNKDSKITDNLGNVYKVNNFEYSLEKKIIKLTDLKIVDIDQNTFNSDLAFLDLNNKELIAKDINLNFKTPEGTENEPRLKGLSLISDQYSTTIKKGTFTLCKRRENCPPWEMSADEIKHDKNKKIIYYKNASLKLYDKKVFYFPKFFHPDPTVKRQTGFLVPKLQDNETSGLSLNLPYFLALAKNKDMTFSPRFFANDRFLLQSEFRQKNKNSDHITDFSQYLSSDETLKGHFFYNYAKNFESEIFDDIEIDIVLQQVSDETYLKAYKLDSPIIQNTSNLTNSISYGFYEDDVSINTNLDVYEDLSKSDSDRYEFVPNFSFSKILDDNYNFTSKGYVKNYNTNITEKVLINNLIYTSNAKYFGNGVINENNLSVKNINSEAKNSSNFKNKGSSSIVPTFQANYTYPLKKETEEFDNTLTPKLSLKFSPNYTKNLRKKDRKIDYNNIYDLERLGISDVTEGGISATYGYEYIKTDKSNLDQKIKFGFANNIRLKYNNDLPANSNLGKKTSDFVGIFEYNPSKNMKLNYDFSLKNNLSDKNYELYGFEFFLDNFSTKLEYVNENNTSLKNSYLASETSYKINEKNSLTFETRQNKEQSFTEFYNLIYQYQNDCLIAGIEYSKDYYNDQDLKPTENLIFKISIIPLGGINTPNLKK